MPAGCFGRGGWHFKVASNRACFENGRYTRIPQPDKVFLELCVGGCCKKRDEADCIYAGSWWAFERCGAYEAAKHKAQGDPLAERLEEARRSLGWEV